MVYHVRGRPEMKVRQLEWLADFISMFALFIAMEGLRKLHSLGQPLSGLIIEAIGAGAAFSLINWIRKHGDD
jgi:hypothetical protein